MPPIKTPRPRPPSDEDLLSRGIVTARLSYNSSTYSIIEGPIESELEIWDDSAGDPPENWRRVYENLSGLQQALRVIGRFGKNRGKRRHRGFRAQW